VKHKVVFYYNLQRWDILLEKWTSLDRGSKEEMKELEENLRGAGYIYASTETRILLAPVNKTDYFGEGDYDYEV
jgi:hypothetical protein